MAAQWISLGSDRWFYYTDALGPLEGGWLDTPRSSQSTLWKLGDPAQLDLVRGKTVRAYRVAGFLENGVDNNVVIAAWPYMVTPQPVFTIPEEYSNATLYGVSLEDTTHPLGRFPDTDAFSDVPSEGWGGLFSADYVHVGGDTGAAPYLDLDDPGCKFEVLVDDTPTWTVDYAAAVTRTASIPLTVTLQYPSGDKVKNFGIKLFAGAKTSVRGVGGSEYAYVAQGFTDDNGAIAFDVRGDFNGTDQLGIQALNVQKIGLFSPTLNAYLPITVVGLPSDDPTQECYQVPAVPGQPEIPARTDIIPTFAWDSGANSVDTVVGDASLRFTMRKVVGVVLGLTTDRDAVLDYARMTHAFFFNQTPAGAMRAQVMEAGVLKGQKIAYTNTTNFEIRRVGEIVTYRIDGELFYASRMPSSGELTAGVALYGTGDQVD